MTEHSKLLQADPSLEKQDLVVMLLFLLKEVSDDLKGFSDSLHLHVVLGELAQALLKYLADMAFIT